MADGWQVIAIEVLGDTDQARGRPVDLGRSLGSESLVDQQFELGPVVKQPLEIKDHLVDEDGGAAGFVFDDHGTGPLVDTKGVDAPTVILARRELSGEHGDAKELLQVAFDEQVQRFLIRRVPACEPGDALFADAIQPRLARMLQRSPGCHGLVVMPPVYEARTINGNRNARRTTCRVILQNSHSSRESPGPALREARAQIHAGPAIDQLGTEVESAQHECWSVSWICVLENLDLTGNGVQRMANKERAYGWASVEQS